MAVTGSDTLDMLLEMPGMNVFASRSDSAPAIEIGLDQPVSEVDCRWITDYDSGDGHTRCHFGVESDGSLYYHFDGEGFVHYSPGQSGKVVMGTFHSQAVLRYALWLAYAMPALSFHAVPVHSSVVVAHGQAVLCLGESGTGKSTHTRLWMQHIAGSNLLNDDSPIVRVESDGVWAYGSPWSGKTPCFINRRVPVRAFVRLSQAPSNKIVRLPRLAAFGSLLPSCPPDAARLESSLDALVDYVGRVVAQVPVYHLDCLPDADAARLCHATLFEA